MSDIESTRNRSSTGETLLFSQLTPEDLAFCDGNLGQVARLLDDEAFRATLSDARSLLRAVSERDKKKTLCALAPYDRKKDDLLELLPVFTELCRQTEDPALILAAEKATTAISQLNSNANPNLVLNNLTIEL